MRGLNTTITRMEASAEQEARYEASQELNDAETDSDSDDELTVTAPLISKIADRRVNG